MRGPPSLRGLLFCLDGGRRQEMGSYIEDEGSRIKDQGLGNEGHVEGVTYILQTSTHALIRVHAGEQ